MFLGHLSFKLSISPSDSINLLLGLCTLARFGPNRIFHIVYLSLALSNMIFDFVHLFRQVVHSALLEVNFALSLPDLLMHASHHDILCFTTIDSLYASPHSEFLVTAILEL